MFIYHSIYFMKKKTIVFLLFILPFVLMGQSFKKEIREHRKRYKNEFLTEERSPIKKDDLKYLRFYKADESFKVKAAFRRTPSSQPFDMATYSGKTKNYIQYGEIIFSLEGKEIKMSIYQGIDLGKIPAYKDYLFLPFKDGTSGTETYGGGRYIDLNINDIQNDTVIVDFNKAYNPYCAYSSGFSCPIPPRENHLSLHIKAGEKNFAKEGAH